MPDKYQNLQMAICDLTMNLDFGNYYEILKPEKGLCFGLSYMWQQALLADGLTSFFAKMDILTQTYPTLDDQFQPKTLSQLINDAREKVKSSTPLNQKDKLYLSILSFLDGIILYHSPSKSSMYLDRADTDLFTQNCEKASKYVMNDTLYNGQDGILVPMTKCFDRPFIGTKNEYVAIIKSVVESAMQMNIPFCIQMGSENHAIALGVINGKMHLYDANALFHNVYYYPLHKTGFDSPAYAECVNGIFFAFRQTETLAINISVFIRPEDADKKLSVMNNMFSKQIARTMTDKLIKKLKDYPDIYKWQLNHQSARASFTAQQLERIDNFVVLKEFLTEERQLCCGNTVLSCKYTHYNGSRPAARNGKEAYYHIIDNALNELLSITMHNEQEKYDKYFLPKAIERKRHLKTLFLYMACCKGHIDVVKRLLQEPDIDPSQVDSTKSTPLFIACQNGHLEVVRELLKHSLKQLNQVDKEGASPLYVASQNGHSAIVRVLLRQPYINIYTAVDGSPPLHAAAKFGYAEVVWQLINCRGADINQATSNGTTALVLASDKGHDNVILTLMKKYPRRSWNFNEYEVYKGKDPKVKEMLRVFCS
ncbi:ankyrin repeat domain-containing protein [Lentisphaerota bacterium ZTH]|nr:ankyrin repeat domain-containing protein [Lentisphaerota bacterium]WET07463.1 ankyrin repeat domain-containing protein [Lentisphaerota bacterium ZTH]